MQNTSITDGPNGNPPADPGSRDPRKQTCPICHGIGFVARDVPVGHPDFGRAIPCQCQQEYLEMARLEDLRRASNLGMLAHMTFESFIPEGIGLNPEKQRNLQQTFKLAQEFARHPQGWLILKGGYGCGKTHLAAAIANYQIEQGNQVLFGRPRSVGSLAGHLQPDQCGHLR